MRTLTWDGRGEPVALTHQETVLFILLPSDHAREEKEKDDQGEENAELEHEGNEERAPG